MLNYSVCQTLDDGPAAMKDRTHSHSLRADTAQPLSILLVEDDASDALLTEIALDDAGMDYQMHILRSGTEVAPYLRSQCGHGKHLPDLLILDLSLPSMDGFEVLSQLAELAVSSTAFSELPIIILTGDSSSYFLKHCYGLHIIAFLVKPCSPKRIYEAMSRLRK